MKKSELIARYMHFNEDLIAIESKEFFSVLHTSKIDMHRAKPEANCDCVSFSIDGWEYYSYYSTYRIGNEIHSDTFQFKIKRISISEKIVIKEIFSRENNFTVFEEIVDITDLIAL